MVPGRSHPVPQQQLCHTDTGSRRSKIHLAARSTSQGPLPFLFLSRPFVQVVKTPWRMCGADPGGNKSGKSSAELAVGDSKMQEQPNGRENGAGARAVGVISTPGLACNFL